jgi:hypothetical protein
MVRIHIPINVQMLQVKNLEVTIEPEQGKQGLKYLLNK